MRDLYRCLSEYSDIMIQALAEAWSVDLPDGDARELAEIMAEAMLHPGAADAVVHGLSPDAHQALAELVRSGGELPSHRLTLSHGTMRRYGALRLEREQPWQHPANAVEELYYSGLVYRAFDAIGDYHGEVLFVPEQLLVTLEPLGRADSVSHLEPVTSPANARADELALMEDLFVGLVGLRETRLYLLDREQLPAVPLDLMREPYAQRLSGEALTERIALVWRLLWRLRLVHEEKGLMRPSQRAREWLRLNDVGRAQQLFLAWRDDPKWDELRLIPSLHCEETGWQNNPVSTRHRLIDILMQYLPEGWVSLSSFLTLLKHIAPDFMRPDGDFDSWHIRDTQTNAYLGGFGAWDQVEGAVAQYILCHSLRWLGVVAVGYADEGGLPTAFRLTELGRMLLTGRPADKALSGKHRLIAVDPQFFVRISLQDTLYERYQLERFAEWQGRETGPDGVIALYRVTAESIWQSQNSGVKMEQIQSFLKRTSQDQIPAAVQRALLAWGGRFGRAFIRRIVVLETVDEQTMRQIKAKPELRQLLGVEISSTSCLVDERHLDQVVERLKALGIWPHVKT